MAPIKRFMFLLIIIFGFCEDLYSQKSALHLPFEAIRDLAKRNIELYDKGVRTQETLWSLQEAMLRGQDWIKTPEEEELMSQIVSRVLLLRKELYNLSDEELMVLMLNSAVSTVTKEKNTFENIPNTYPDFKVKTSDPQSILKMSLILMEKGEMKEAEKNLLVLFYDTWYNKNNSSFKYQVANKLGLLYLSLHLPERCYDVLRFNKIEMEKTGILDRDYIETLVYMGFAEMEKCSSPIVGDVFLEVASHLCKKYDIDPNEIILDYKRVIANPDLQSEPISMFIKSNDKNFYFLTERERIIRWNNIKGTWEDLKKITYEKESKRRVEELLNAFQYEKQILLRSALKMKQFLVETHDAEASRMIDRLLKIKMEMTSPKAFAEIYDDMNAEYENIQKYLMHCPAIKNLEGSLYSPLKPVEIALKLRKDETFIDFGKIETNDGVKYVAIIITDDSPGGLIVSLCSQKSLRNFIASTESEDSRTSVRKRYENAFLYENLWKPLEETGLIKNKILYCPSYELNMIMPDAIKKGDNYLGENYEFHILSSAESIEDIRKGENYNPEGIISFCGMDYIGDREQLIKNAQYFGCERPLIKNPFDKDEKNSRGIHIETSVSPLDTRDDYQWLIELGKEYNTNIGLWTGERANEYKFKQLGTYRGAINITTHAFNIPRGYNEIGNHYFVAQSVRNFTVEPLTKDLLPLYRSGLFLSGAERSWTGRNFIDDIEDGIINGEEISSLDLSGLELITLMACGTGSGEVDEYEGIIGLRRAFKMAGAGSLISTAWNLDKEAAFSYLQIFYSNLVKGHGITKSHREAQLELIKRYEEPYYWAVFQLID